jgi:hypothetical protein
VHSPHAFLLALLFYNAIVVAGVAGIVLVAYAVRRARAENVVDRRLAVAAGLLVPGLLVAAYAGPPAGGVAGAVLSVAGVAGAALAGASVGLYLTGRAG